MHHEAGFQPSYEPKKNNSGPLQHLDEGYWFIFLQNNLLLPKGSQEVPLIWKDPSSATQGTPADGSSPRFFDLSWALGRIQRIYYFGTLEGKPCWGSSLSGSATTGSSLSVPLDGASGSSTPVRGSSAHGQPAQSLESIPSSWEWVNLRMAYGRLPTQELQAARFASHLLFWDRNTRFCGVCGFPTQDKPDERAKLCTDPSCGAVIYPKISPAVIVAVLDGDRILLAHNRRFASKFYSLIAGFVEIGESLEDCVHREVEEEVGVQVKNVRYFGSQPWPTPDSLMIGFLADYAGGEVRIQDDELHDARWFSPPDMPSLPPSDSIARRILQWYETEYVPKVRCR